jgi:hypothetical protein
VKKKRDTRRNINLSNLRSFAYRIQLVFDFPALLSAVALYPVGHSQIYLNLPQIPPQRS